MNDFTTELLTLEEILVQHNSLKAAYFHAKVNARLSESSLRLLKERLIVILRHYQSLSFECLNLFSKYEKNSKEFLLNLIVLAILRYEKNSDAEAVMQAYRETMSQLRLSMDFNGEKELLLNACKAPFVIPDEIKKAPVVYNSLVLEIPDFLLRSLSEDFGNTDALSIALSLHGNCSHYLVKTNKEDSSLLKEEGLEPIHLSAQNVLYKVNKNFSSQDKKEKGLLPISYLEACALNRVNLPSIAPNVLICNSKSTSLYRYLSACVSSSYDGKVVPVFDSSLSYRLCMDAVKKEKITNVYPLLAKSNLMKTYLSFDEFDLVVSCSDDSKTGMARRYVEILPSLSSKEFFKPNQKQEEELQDASLFVKEGGYLLFISYALNKRENVDVVAKFLKENKKFALQNQEFLFPDKTEQEGGYYALLRRTA